MYYFQYSVSILRRSRNRCQIWMHANTFASINDTNSFGYINVLFQLFHLTRIALYECCIINHSDGRVISCTQSQCIYTIDNCNIILRIVLLLINIIDKNFISGNGWLWKFISLLAPYACAYGHEGSKCSTSLNHNFSNCTYQLSSSQAVP